MNSIARSINAVAHALNRIATAMEKNTSIKNNTVTNTSVTSNGPVKFNVPPNNIKYFTPPNDFKKIENPKTNLSLDSIINDIYMAMNDKGIYPHHHEAVAKQMKSKWPVLFNALDRLVNYVDKNNGRIKGQSNYDSYKEIWKKHSGS